MCLITILFPFYYTALIDISIVEKKKKNKINKRDIFWHPIEIKIYYWFFFFLLGDGDEEEVEEGVAINDIT